MATTAFKKWPRDPHARWVHAANTFGRHLMAAARDYAVERIPDTVPREQRRVAEQCALDAIYGMMMLLDGVCETKLDPSHRMEYVLLARVVETGKGEALEEFELAPDGDGLCMGYHGWAQGDFDGA